MKYEWLVVGAGLAGCTCAERLSAAGRSVLLIDKRDEIGGNCADNDPTEASYLQQYGPHIFHTNYEDAWDYLSRFTEWTDYVHRAVADVNGRLVPIPVNLNTIDELWPEYSLAVGNMGDCEFTIDELTGHKDEWLQCLGKRIYTTMFEGYSRKQWGEHWGDLDAKVLGRIPVRFNRNDNMFTDAHQGLPKHGYTAMCERLTENVEVRLNTSFDSVNPGDYRIVYTGPLDEWFGCDRGRLPYRGVEFYYGNASFVDWRSAAVINYPGGQPFTRSTDFRYMVDHDLCCNSNRVWEVPMEYEEGKSTQAYPVPTTQSAAMAAEYRSRADKLRPHVWFVGRLAEYRYYNMDEVVLRALGMTKELLG